MPYVALYIPGAAEPRRHELLESNVFGRSSGCDVCVDDPNVSREHCRIDHVDGRWVLRDTDSTNGTWLDAARVRRYALRDGETFYLGDTRVVFHAGPHIEHRPLDPHEAIDLSKVLIMRELRGGSASPGPEGQADAETAPRRRPLPNARATVVVPGEHRRTAPAKSLAFRRAPAMPMVLRDERPRNWLDAAARALRGGLRHISVTSAAVAVAAALEARLR